MSAKDTTPAEASLWMARALALAAQARGHCHPNPMVGCVIVQQEGIVGEGWHCRAGTPHAEVHALKAAGSAARGATVYVTLEPCNHWGQTPPCTQALIEAGVTKVVIAMLDPNPVAQGGVACLRQAGIEVVVGDGAVAAQRLNERWLVYVQEQRPFVHLKVAMSLDGKVATHMGESRWITGAAARQMGHHWRDSHEAIVVGANTVREDDPALTCRLLPEELPSPVPVRQPLRVVLAGGRPLPASAKLFRDGLAPTLVVTTAAHYPAHRRMLVPGADQVEVICLPAVDGHPDPAPLLRVLYEREVVGVLLEGGPRVAAAFLNARLVDRVSMFVAPKLIGPHGVSAFQQADVLQLAEVPVLHALESVSVGHDLLITGRI